MDSEFIPLDPVMRQGGQFSTVTKCATLELFHFASLAKPRWVESTVDDVTLPQWLDPSTSPLPVDGISSETAESGLRLLIAIVDLEVVDDSACMRMSIRKDTFTNLQHRLPLPDYFQTLVSSHSTRGFKYSVPSQDADSQNGGFLWRCAYYREDYIQLAINHDPRTNISTGLALVRPKFNIIAVIRSAIEGWANPRAHPLLLPLIFLDNEVRLINEQIWSCHCKLDHLAKISGQYEWDGSPLPDPLEVNFVSAIRRLTFLGRVIASITGQISSIILALEQASQYASFIDMPGNITSSSTQHCKNDRSSAILAARTEYLRNTCNVLLLEAKCDKSGIQDVIQAVYQFMVGKDAKTNFSLAETSAIMAKASKEDSAVMRTIAIESKRDSSAMKTISILGMLFLPGTFIAAIFGMQVFNWDGDGAPVVKPGFKYYWAVTIPVTVLVLATWALAMFLPWKEWFGKGPGRLRARHSPIKDQAEEV